jgi:hypothetical protein
MQLAFVAGSSMPALASHDVATAETVPRRAMRCAA